MDFASKLPFARDRLVECYFWILGVYFEPQYALARRIVTKVIAMTSVLDDIYDIYGTLEELELFTDAIDRFSFDLHIYTYTYTYTYTHTYTYKYISFGSQMEYRLSRSTPRVHQILLSCTTTSIRRN